MPLNHINDLEAFLRRWDRGTDLYHPPLNRLRRGSLGHINNLGTIDCPTGQILTSSHPEFFEIIEPGVLHLVRVLIERMHYITYSSCEGHPGTPEGFRERQVGIIPRNQHEYAECVVTLVRAANLANRSFPMSAAVVLVSETLVTSERSEYAAVDVIFSRRGSEESYFEHVDTLYERFLMHLTPDTNSSCNIGSH